MTMSIPLPGFRVNISRLAARKVIKAFLQELNAMDDMAAREGGGEMDDALREMAAVRIE